MIVVEANPYKSIIVVDENGELITISENNDIQFELETSKVVKQGTITKFLGKNEKLRIQMISKENMCEEIWSINIMKEGTLKLVTEDNDEE